MPITTHPTGSVIHDFKYPGYSFAGKLAAEKELSIVLRRLAPAGSAGRSSGRLVRHLPLEARARGQQRRWPQASLVRITTVTETIIDGIPED